MIKYENYDPLNASNCVIRAFSKITSKDPLVIEQELKELASVMNRIDYTEIEVFEQYLKSLNFSKLCIDYKDMRIRDLKLNHGIYIIFCWDRNEIYHMVALSNGIVYDKREDTLNLYPISIYELTDSSAFNK